MVRALASVTVAAAALLAITAAPVGAQANKCDASKLKATGTKCNAKAKCVAKGAAKGEAVDATCMTKAETKFAAAFVKAEGKGGCSTTGDAPTIEGKVDAHVLDVRGELWTDEPTENDCGSSKLKAAGKKCSCKLKCSSKAASKGVSVDPACLSKCETKFSSGFAKAEAKGGCTTTGDDAAIEAKVDAFVTDAATEIQPSLTTTTAIPTTTTTTTTIPSACSNGTIESPEECDDSNTAPGDGCSATCQLESVNPAVCAGVPTVAGTSLTSVRIASGLTSPLHITGPRLDPRRVYVAEKPGRVRVIRDGTLLVTPLLEIEGIVRDTGSEEGLFSVAFHPDFETNGQFFVYYVNNSGNLEIARYGAPGGDPENADEGTAHIVVTIPHPMNTNHNGGNLNFGPDGFLYAATGDGGSGGDPPDNAQNDSSRLGKLLRIDPATDTVTNWAKGLRNPWRWSFDRANGDLYIGDVGQGSWEEISYMAAPITSGTNYGWDVFEGRHCFEPTPLFPDCASVPPSFSVMPVLEYCNSAHSEPACSTFQPEKGVDVAGGFVYRGCAMPDVSGEYFYADTAFGWIRSFKGVSGGNAQNMLNRTTDLDPPGAQAINNPSSFGEDARGEIYVADLGDGEIYKIIPGP